MQRKAAPRRLPIQSIGALLADHCLLCSLCSSASLLCRLLSPLSDKAVLSSPNLQMFLYYHFFYSLAYTWFFALSYRWKYLNFDGLRVNFFTPVFFTCWALAEMARIYVGYQGNLKEDVRARQHQWGKHCGGGIGNEARLQPHAQPRAHCGLDFCCVCVSLSLSLSVNSTLAVSLLLL